MTQGGFGNIEMNLDSWSHVPFVMQEVLGVAPRPPKCQHTLSTPNVATFDADLNTQLYSKACEAISQTLILAGFISASQQKAEQGEEYDDYGPPFTFQDSKGEVIATGQIHGGLPGWGRHWLLVRRDCGEIADLLIAELSKTSTHRSAFAALGPDDLGTMFSVYKDVSLVAKALCGYHNGEVCTAGPTLEFIETASQWQCQSREIGSALLESLSAFDSDRFSHI
jgi:hypothetical protein